LSKLLVKGFQSRSSVASLSITLHVVPVDKKGGLTRSEFERLANIPPEEEWLANIRNDKTRRAYRRDVREFVAFSGSISFEELRSVTRAHVTVANVRIHGETHKQPSELFALEKPHLNALPPLPADTGVIRTVPTSSRFRAVLDANRYSVPCLYASQSLLLKTFADRLCIYHGEKLIATHPRSYDRHQDFEDPEHGKELLDQRREARDAKLLLRFFGLCPRAEEYYLQLKIRRLNPRQHIAKILPLSEVHGCDEILPTSCLMSTLITSS
jgi:hypothetical protein